MIDNRVLDKKDEIRDLIRENIDTLFSECQSLVGCDSGDITPWQVIKLGSIEKNLHHLIMEQLSQNLPIKTCENQK